MRIFYNFLVERFARINKSYYLCGELNEKDMITIEEVQSFLNQFHAKIKVYDIIFRDDRNKNIETLTALEITPSYRKDVIKKIKALDYSEGPIIDTLNNYGEMWVFGKEVKGREVYIKISMGRPNLSTICISFHLAEYSIIYPFKKQES